MRRGATRRARDRRIHSPRLRARSHQRARRACLARPNLKDEPRRAWLARPTSGSGGVRLRLVMTPGCTARLPPPARSSSGLAGRSEGRFCPLVVAWRPRFSAPGGGLASVRSGVAREFPVFLACDMVPGACGVKGNFAPLPPNHGQQSVRGDSRSMGTKLYVGNLNYNTTEDSLKEAFSANGREVASVSIIMDRETGRSRGFAFVEMATAEGAQQALQELDGADLDGRTLRINEARERDARGPRSFGGPRSGGPGPSGGYGGGGGGGGYQGRPSGGGFGGGPPSGGAPRGFSGGPPPGRNFGPPAAPGGARRKEKERGRDDDDRGKKGRRRDPGDDTDGW